MNIFENNFIEKLETIRKNYLKKFVITDIEHFTILKLQEEVGELTQAYLTMAKMARPRGKTDTELKEAFGEEIADVLCMTLLLANDHRVDVEKAIERKWLKWLK